MLPHPHTGKEINAKLCFVFAAFNISDKILCATTDGGANVVLAMRLLKDKLILKNYNFHFQPCRCLAHILNLIITTGLSPIKSSIEKVRNFVNVISSSLSITQDFKELGQTVGEGELTRKIPQDVSTHWNSTYLMLSAYVTMPMTISAIIRRNKNLEKFKLTPQDETNLQVTTQFLKLFYETTNVLSGSTYTTLGISILLIDDIIENVLACIQDPTSPEFLKIAAIQMSEKIQKYTNEIYNKTAFIAAILDPRIKLELMPIDMNNEANHTIFNNVFRSEYADLILNNSSTSLTSSISSTSTSSTNLKVPLNLTYTEQIAQKR
ncbi:7821_t:CDS:1 [Dentiscutata heterogama]|uniref:7821_t:CDS:1 n=1 Tax=Dentiscutata heterogama TaxID=1316150 RepID=A0ACA9MQ36_9GLOM|nr:7821_t:CDS:1 [Dentiscutata heterogama]